MFRPFSHLYWEKKYITGLVEELENWSVRSEKMKIIDLLAFELEGRIDLVKDLVLIK
jgi:hypothetical protein